MNGKAPKNLQVKRTKFRQSFNLPLLQSSELLHKIPNNLEMFNCKSNIHVTAISGRPKAITCQIEGNSS